MADPRWGGPGTINSFLGKFGVTGAQAKQYGPWAIGGIVVLIVIIFLFRRYKGKAGKLFSLKSKGGGGGSKWNVDLGSSKTGEKKKGVFSSMFDAEPGEEKETNETSPAKTKEEKDDEKKKKGEIIDILVGYLKEFKTEIESALRNLGSRDYIDVIKSMNDILDTIKNRAMKDLDDYRKALGRLFAGIIEDFLNNLKSYAEIIIQSIRRNDYDQAKAYLERMEDDITIGIREVEKQKPTRLKSIVKKQKDFRGK